MWLSLAMMVLSQAPECHQSGGNLACGYYCRAELGEVQCAKTPQGICTRLEREIVCWDPPDEARLHLPASAKPICKAKPDDVVCGYSCLTSQTRIACTQTPWGVCGMRHDDVECWDPSPEVIHSFASTGELTGAKCVATDQGIVCGWDCKTSYRETKCAQTPKGTCTVNRGKLSCFDPPLAPAIHTP